MILAIDGYEANIPHPVGIGRYAYELLRHMYKTTSKFSRVRVYVPGFPLSTMPNPTTSWLYRVISPKLLWTFFGLPRALAHDKPTADVVFSPTHYVPRFTAIPKVMAIMDVSYLHYPELFRRQDLHKLVNWTAYAVRHASRIVTISQFSKRAIIKAYQVPENRIVVVYPALRTLGQAKAVSMKLPKKYILSVSTLQPRKNFSRLIEAFALLSDKEVALIIVGKKGWLYEEILASPAKYGVQDRVHFLDYVKDEELPGLYKGAVCFALPSLYEGFGLPVLEAMSYKIPVVVSDTSSLPEIAGDAGIYVEPESVKSIAQGLTIALTESPAQKEKRVSRGASYIKKFSWEKSATQVMQILEEVAKAK